MTAFDDHPVTLLLRRYGLTQSELAQRAGVSRSTVDQIVQGRVRRLNRKVAAELSALANVPTETLEEVVNRWHDAELDLGLKERHRMVLSVAPEDIRQVFRTFADWRAEFAPTPSTFASLLRTNALTVSKYERGLFAAGMPPSLHQAIVKAFGASDEYVLALARLPVGVTG